MSATILDLVFFISNWIQCTIIELTQIHFWEKLKTTDNKYWF